MYTEFLLSLSQNFIRKKLPLEGVFSYPEYFQLVAEILIFSTNPSFPELSPYADGKLSVGSIYIYLKFSLKD